MDKERREKSERRITKTIHLGEFVEGHDSKRTGHRFLSISENTNDGVLIRTLQALSWGHDSRNWGAEREEFVIAKVLGYIDQQYTCGGLDKVLQLLTEKGNDGVKLTLSQNSWSMLYEEEIYLKFGKTFNIPKPPPLII